MQGMILCGIHCPENSGNKNKLQNKFTETLAVYNLLHVYNFVCGERFEQK